MNDQPPANVTAFALPVPSLPRRKIADMVFFAESFEVTDAESAEIAAADLQAARAIEKAAKAELDEWLKPLGQVEARAREQYRPILDGAKRAAQLLDRKLGAYQQRQEEARRQLEVQAREGARLEQERLAHEAATREEQARVTAANLRAAAKAQAELGNSTSAAQLNCQAEQAELAGQQDAQQIVEQLQLTAPAPVEATPKPAGVTFRKVIDRIEVYDIPELACACVEGKQPMAYILPDLVALRQSAIALGDSFNVPGVRVIWRTSTAVKGNRK